MNIFLNYVKKLRLSNPWNYKAPLLISIPYFLILACSIPFKSSLFYIGLSFCTIVGIAGFGYYTNDWADINKDFIAGKSNALSEMSLAAKLVVLFVLLIFALAPWYFFPMDKWSWILLVLEFLLFVLYAFPPFRLKEKGFLGVLTDALYAHVVPSLLAANTFYLIGNNKFDYWFEFLMILVLWQFTLGIRNILLHQILDFNNDLTSGNKTFVVKRGVLISEVILKRILLPIEIIVFSLLMLIISTQFYFYTLGYLIFITYTFARIYLFKKEKMPQNYRGIYYQFFDNFYLDWFPLVILTSLVAMNFYFFILLFLHILLFRNILKATFLKPLFR